MTMMLAGTLMAIAGCATKGPAQPAADTAASSLTTASNAPAVASKAMGTSDRDNVRCKRSKVTGSRLGAKECHTEEEWVAIEKQREKVGKEIVKDINRQGAFQGRAQ